MHKTKLGLAAAVAAAIAVPAAGAWTVQAKPSPTALHAEPLRAGLNLRRPSAADARTIGTAHLTMVQYGGDSYGGYGWWGGPWRRVDFYPNHYPYYRY
jgi:hypothetical protein